MISRDWGYILFLLIMLTVALIFMYKFDMTRTNNHYLIQQHQVDSIRIQYLEGQVDLLNVYKEKLP